MNGISATHTIRVVGVILDQPVNILVDSGSTHNFINSSSAKKLGLQSQESKSIDVLVANGDKISGNGIRKAVELECQGV